MKHSTWTGLTCLAISLATGAACTKKKAAPPSDQSSTTGAPLSAQRGNFGILNINVDLRDDGMQIHLSGVPSGSSLECTLDEKPLIPCSDGGIYARPKPGDHKIGATALKDQAITALGESAVFTVVPGGSGMISGGDSALALTLDDANFVSGANVPLSKDFSVHFKLATKPPCDAPQIRCKYDSQTSPFWTLCGTSFAVGKDQLAQGLQLLSVQASCNDKTGPILSLFWYGVPDGFQPLMLRDLSDANGRHTIDLIKQDDCVDGVQRSYECAQSAADQFTPCSGNSNVLDHPAAGYRVRLVCGGSNVGPALTIGAPNP